MIYVDRFDAGRVLASRLMAYAGLPDVIVLALPRGGVPVGYEVARALHAPLDVFLVRKLGVPGHEELAMGAIASGGLRVLNPDVVEGLHIPEHLIDRVAQSERSELNRREHEYRDDRPPPDVRGKIVILVDDGLATGATMRAALLALRQEHPQKLIAAVPVAPRSTCQELRAVADEVVCVRTPEPFYGVGMWYQDFAPTSDDEVRHLLQLALEQTGAAAETRE
ncbi:MAG TPA: phosphoribosyltransferase, partial [Ktedonobacterales bacterium]